MISELVKKDAIWFRGVAHYPINVCMHCGESDDPEGYWAEDADGDRMCRRCEVDLEYQLEKSIEIVRMHV